MAPAPALALESDDAIRQRMIQESINAYRGVCACPYNLTSRGRRCGGNSAYSKPGGARPLCFPSDITPQMLATYRKQKGL